MHGLWGSSILLRGPGLQSPKTAGVYVWWGRWAGKGVSAKPVNHQKALGWLGPTPRKGATLLDCSLEHLVPPTSWFGSTPEVLCGYNQIAAPFQASASKRYRTGWGRGWPNLRLALQLWTAVLSKVDLAAARQSTAQVLGFPTGYWEPLGRTHGFRGPCCHGLQNGPKNATVTGL